MPEQGINKIVIVGSTGTGKTTLARQLSKTLGLTLVDLDELYWNPDWVASDIDTFRQRVDKALPDNRWVVTGNYSAIRDFVWSRSDTLIWIDYSFIRTFTQLAKRTMKSLITGEIKCNGNREQWCMQFLSRRSIFLWLFKTYSKNKRQYGDIFKNQSLWPNIKTYIHLASPRTTKLFINNLIVIPVKTEADVII